MALTDTAIKALKPRAKRYFVTDDRGLSLKVYPTGGMAWRYRYRLNGKLEKVVLGKYPPLSLKAARKKRDEMATAVAQGESEKALNHTIGGVRGIYNRAEYASQRREMLQFWADYVDALANEKKVILGNFGKQSSAA
jgi:hypothetical protein